MIGEVPLRESSTWPGVSVVVPTRQRPHLLLRALRSIRDQRYLGEVEMLVVFDQETPLVPELTLTGNRSLRVLTNYRTPGLAGARNSGILAAGSELVAHCDDDDEWLPDKLRLQVEALDGSPEVEVVATGVSIVYKDRSIDRIPTTGDLRFEHLLRSRVQEVHPSSLMARRDTYLHGVGLVDENLPGSYGEDYDWLLRAARRHPIRLVSQPLVRAHWHRSSFFADRWATIVDALEYLIHKHPEFEQDRRGLARLYGQLAFANAALGRHRDARDWARRTIRLDPRERRAYLALGVSSGVVSVDTVMRLAHRMGKGI